MINYALIVDPFASGALYAEELIRRNISPLAVLSHYPIVECYQASFKKEDFVHIFIYQDNIEQLIDKIRSYTENGKIQYCLPGAESGVVLADNLANIFCPEKTNVQSLSQARTNKYWMSRQLSRVGLSLPLTHRVDSADEAIEWATNHNLITTGVVVKPLDSAGTDGVSLCFNKNNIISGVNAILGKKNKLARMNEHALIQEFLVGEEYVVDTVSYQGTHTLTNVCKYTKITKNGCRFIYDHLDFLSENDDRIPCLTDYCYQVLDGLGIKNGPAHAEIMLTKEGPRLIEIGSRLHGGVGILAARLATGSSQLDRTLDLFEKNALENLSFHLKNTVKIVFLISPASGIVAKTEIHKIENLPGFAFMKTDIKEGMSIKKTVDLFTSPGLIILAHHDPLQVEKDYRAIRSLEEEGLIMLDTQLISRYKD